MVMTLASVDPITLTVGLLLSAAVTAGGSLLLGALNRPKSPVADNTPPVLTDRGSPLPMLIGRRRLKGFLCWAGDRQLVKSGGGGKGLLGAAGGSQSYFERGWHVLCVGPASALYGIYENGTKIWPTTASATGPITPTDTPSGSHIKTKRGDAYIYWGDVTQPVDPVLSVRLGTVSQWPCICYVFWNRKNLGAQQTWPVIEYDLAVQVMDQVLSDSLPWLGELTGPTTGNTVTFTSPITLDTAAYSLGAVGIVNQVVRIGTRVKKLGTDYTLDAGLGQMYFLSSGTIKSTDNVTVKFDTQGDGRDGPNPAHVLWQVLTAPAPYGFAIDPAFMDGTAFETLGTLSETEHQACHLLATGGISGTDLVGQIMTDLSMVIPQVGDVLSPFAIRAVDPSTIPVITDSMLALPAPPQREQTHEGILPDRLVFTIPDRSNNYRDMDIVIDDDSQSSLRDRSKQTQISIPTVTDRATGSVVAQRRAQELLTNTEKYTFPVTRAARNLWAGQPFIYAPYGVLRVVTVEKNVGDRTARIEAAIDQYSGTPGSYTPGDVNNVFVQGQSTTAQPDLAAAVQELPEALSQGKAIGVLRIRDDEDVTGGAVWVSRDNITYTQAGSQDVACAGGTLTAAMPAVPYLIDQGYLFSPLNDDIQNVADLSGNDAAWQSGSQLAVIDDEIMFLRNVTAVGSSWRLDGLMRGRYDTDPATHSAGAMVYIISASDLEPVATPLMQSGVMLYVKIQPTTSTDEVDISTITPLTLTIGSPRALRPLPPDNFLANRINAYSAGADVIFTWNYRVKDGSGRAADEVPAGVAIGSGTPTHEGVFQIQIFDIGMTLKRTLTVNDDTGTTTYSHANLIADFGSEPASFVAQLANVSGAYQSTVRTITIVKE